jgi:hypothetical protein
VDAGPVYRLVFELSEADLEALAGFLAAFSQYPDAVPVMVEAVRTGDQGELLAILTELETVDAEQVDRVFWLLGKGMSALGELLTTAAGKRDELAASIPMTTLEPVGG